MSGSRNRDIQVFIEADEGKIKSVGLELLALDHMLVDKAGEELTAVILGRGSEEATAQVHQYGADKIISVEGPEHRKYSFDAHTYTMTGLVQTYGLSATLIGAINNDRDSGPRLSYRLHTGLTTDCTSLDYGAGNGNVAWTGPAFGGNLMTVIMCPNTRPQANAVHPSVFKKLLMDQKEMQVIRENISVSAEKIRTRLVGSVREAAPGIVNLENIEIIMSDGRDMDGPESFKPLEELAGVLGAVVGASRAVVDVGWIDHARQVGQTGKIVEPKPYIVYGISGVIQHLMDVSGFGCIVVANKDPEAPTFKATDCGIVGNLFEVLPVLIEEIRKLKA